MSSIVLANRDSYVNIGTATAWREILPSHATSMWLKTSSHCESCLLSLSNATHEVFAIDVNVPVPMAAPRDSLESSVSLRSPAHATPTKGDPLPPAPAPPSTADGSPAPPGSPSHASAVVRRGLRVRLEDVQRNTIEAWTEVPDLADNRWHLLEVQVQNGAEVCFRIDGRFINCRYSAQARVGDFTSSGIVEKPLYPACDLIGARNHHRHLCDYFCGRIADVTVARGGFDGPALHMWITDMTSGRTVWDRGQFSVRPPGMHLHCCNTAWDSHDFPPACLLVDGSAGNYVVSRALTTSVLRSLVKPETATSESLPSTPASAQRPLLSPTSGQPTPTHSGSTCSARTPKASAVDSRTPTHSSMNSRSVEKVRNVVSARVSFTIWISTLSRAPAVVLSIPCGDPINLLLNYDGKTPSVALVVGSAGFVSLSDVCDGRWRQLEWIVDPASGCSLFIDGHLSTWEPVSLAEMQRGSQRAQNSPTAAGGEARGGATADPFSDEFSRVSFAADEEGGGAPSSSASSSSGDSVLLGDEEGPAPFEGPRFTAFAVHGGQEPPELNVVAAGRVEDGNPPTSSRGHDHRRHQQSRSKSQTILEIVAAQVEMLARSVNSTSYLERSSDHGASATRLLVPLHGAELLHSNTSTLGTSGSDVTAQRRPSSREIDALDPSGCVCIGRMFAGKIREVTLTIGPVDFYWPLHEGSGRVMRNRLRPSMLSMPVSEDEDVVASVASNALNPEYAAELEVCGRFTVWPKTVWPSSCIDFYPGQACDLGYILVPRARARPFEVSFYTRLYKSAAHRHYGHLLEVSGVVIVECAKACIIVTIPCDGSQIEAGAGAEGGVALRSFVCASLALEDGKWHLLRCRLENGVRSVAGVKLSIDETPVELAPASLGGAPPGPQEVAPSSGSRSGHAGDRQPPRARQRRAASNSPAVTPTATTTPSARRRTTPAQSSHPLQLVIGEDAFNQTCGSDPDGERDGGGGSDREDSTMGESLLVTPMAVPQARRQKFVSSFLGRKRRVLLEAKQAPHSAGLASEPAWKAAVVLGGFFRGSIQHLTVDAGPGFTSFWPLDEGCGHKLRRHPVTMDPALVRHPNHAALLSNSAAMAASAMSHEGVLRTAPFDWQPTRLPASALHFDGRATHVTARGIGRLFPPSSFARFSLVVWVKESARGATCGCIASIHDISSPIVDAATGIYSHSRLDTRASPKKRVFEPFITTFILSDSSERTLALETRADIYDGLWHKVEWVVVDSERNNAVVLVDGHVVASHAVAEESPQDFRGKDHVLNVGARDEGDGGVISFFRGEIRCLKVQVDDQDLISWPMDEGAGNVVHDDCNRLVGEIVQPRWVLTTFPPLTPVFSADSGMEFSPVRDMYDELQREGITINATIMSVTRRRGTVISFLNRARRVVGYFAVNEGGEASGVAPEVGTHTLTLLRRAQRPALVNDSDNGSDGAPASAARPSVSPWASFRGKLRPNRREERRISGGDAGGPAERCDYSPRERRPTLPMISSVEAAPVASQSSLRRVVSRRFVKELLSGNGSPESARRTTSPSREKVPTRLVDCLEEVTFQVHHDELCDGRWHHLRIDLLPAVESSSFAIDNIQVPMMMLARRYLPLTAPDGTAAAVDPAWESFIVGRSPEMPSFRGCLKGVSVYTLHGDPLLFVPLAGSTKFSSNVGRDVATSNMRWELAVPPPSCVYLANQGYIIVPPLPAFTFNRFHISLHIRTPCMTTACIIELGQRGGAYLCLMLNQDASGRFMPNTLHGIVSDADCRELHAFCVSSVAISDNKWHTLSWEVRNAAENDMAFAVDGADQVVRYGECGSPMRFERVDEGGSIGAVLEALTPKHLLQGLVQKVALCSSGEPHSEVYARWDLNSGYGTVLTDSSGNRNHATAVQPIWRSEIRAPPKFEVPNKARDLFQGAAVSVSRWSNNPHDEAHKNPLTGDTLMNEWPGEEGGWQSGAVGPQWISIDLGNAATIFRIEVTLHKASPSTHEIWCSRTNINNSRLASMPAPPEGQRIPAISRMQTFTIKSTSSRTLHTDFKTPQFNVRWIRFKTTQSIVPVSVQRVRILGLSGQWRMHRAYSIMRPLVDAAAGGAPSNSTDLSESPSSMSLSLNASGRGAPAAAAVLDAIDQPEAAPTQHLRSAAEKEHELRRLFYTIDVDRTGLISTREFLVLYKQADVIGTLSEDRVFVELRDAGVHGEEMDFEQFRKILARIDRW